MEYRTLKKIEEDLLISKRTVSKVWQENNWVIIEVEGKRGKNGFKIKIRNY